ncbi:hypothetical protein JTE90_007586 [Oedothorax gibbosus]|uniref:Uncharacterized protein n=1 Tax=Oedothorax gibbosus TaxID=931172 RepID=A0AAV6TIL3_9ARAC|nr:hypothetical protein JTE90_007586 [Oedothorax gibbosus]
MLVCERVSISYLMDLYSLYQDKNSPRLPPVYLKPVTMLKVDSLMDDPEDWLNCIRWTRSHQRGDDTSLEWFIARPKGAGFYYSLGEDGSVLMPRDDRMSILTINPETVLAVSGQSSMACSKPVLQVWDKSSNETTVQD